MELDNFPKLLFFYKGLIRTSRYSLFFAQVYNIAGKLFQLMRIKLLRMNKSSLYVLVLLLISYLKYTKCMDFKLKLNPQEIKCLCKFFHLKKNFMLTKLNFPFLI